MAKIALQVGAILNERYRIVKLLGQGGFGTLYRAWDETLERDCALKENLEISPEAQRQFLREAKILAGLHHPNLPRVTDFFISQGRGQYLVMDFIQGQDLQEMLDEHGAPLNEDQVLPWVEQICDALDYLHGQTPAVIHRDIKPGNIKVTPDGRAVLIDFGIAKTYSTHLKTTAGAQAVSPGFSPIEQYGRGTTDARTDLYALGATLYSLLTGKEPPESVQRIGQDPFISPRNINPRISNNTSSLITQALQLDPEQRFQTAKEFKSAIISRKPSLYSPKQNKSAVSASLPGGDSFLQKYWIGITALIAFVLVLIPVLLGLRNQRGDLKEPVTQTAIVGALIPSATWTPGTTKVPAKVVFTSTPEPQPFVTPLVYDVAKGDTCGGLAEAFGVSLQEIIEINNLSTDCLISADQKLLILNPADLDDTSLITVTLEVTPTTVITKTSRLDSMTMVYIPAGPFLIGSDLGDSQASEDEMPQHWVYLNAFWMDLTEVTNGMYARCVQAGACSPPAEKGSQTRLFYFDDPRYINFPVIHVSWEDANQYCLWAGRRLPTEAEWEKAARGIDGSIYPWGESLPGGALLNYDNQIGDTVRIGSYSQGKSPYGLLDMSGNVSEWVADRYTEDYYDLSPSSNPLGPSNGDFRVMRGGSWLSRANAVRTAFRLWNSPDLQTEVLGFRCALYAESR